MRHVPPPHLLASWPLLSVYKLVYVSNTWRIFVTDVAAPVAPVHDRGSVAVLPLVLYTWHMASGSLWMLHTGRMKMKGTCWAEG